MTNRTRARAWAAVLVACASAAGCAGNVEFSKLNRPPHKLVPRAAKDVELFARKRPTRAFTEVYLLEADSSSQEGSADLMRTMREKAGQLGCDALVLSASTAAMEVSVVARAYQAVCIVYD